MKRGGGRRYYRPEDVDLLRAIRSLLYDDGYTIKGVQKLLREGGFRPDDAEDGPAALVDTSKPIAPVSRAKLLSGADKSELRMVLGELEALKKLLDSAR